MKKRNLWLTVGIICLAVACNSEKQQGRDAIKGTAEVINAFADYKMKYEHEEFDAPASKIKSVLDVFDQIAKHPPKDQPSLCVELLNVLTRTASEESLKCGRDEVVYRLKGQPDKSSKATEGIKNWAQFEIKAKNAIDKIRTTSNSNR